MVLVLLGQANAQCILSRRGIGIPWFTNKLVNSLHFLQALVTLALTAVSAPPSNPLTT